jgi:endonuclease/exonuclease/phosphatase family metal-dependent hydrolase
VLLVAGLVAFAALRDRSSSQSGARARAPGRGPEREPARPHEHAAPRARSKAIAGRVPVSSPFHSSAACEAHVRSMPRVRSRGPRIGTWNVRWFPYGTTGRDLAHGTDLGWLACAIASLDVDVLAVQEFVQDPAGRGALLDLRARLDAITGGLWRAQLDDCPGNGFQHVGFLFDSERVQLHSPRELAALNPGKSACERSLRPGFGAYARFASGPDLHLIALHFDSGVSERDFTHRARSVAALGRVVPELADVEPDPDLLLLGDFNTMGCKDCEPRVAADAEIERMDARLGDFSLTRLTASPPAQTCSQYYRGKAGTLDHIVARTGMEELLPDANVEVHGVCRELACGPAAVGEDVDAWERLSDHCPLVIELRKRDRDR